MFVVSCTVNVMYAMMIALIPDQVPKSQIGVANGILALLLVTGSLFGFGLFHSVLGQKVSSMYALYTCIVIFTSILTGTNAHDKDADIAYYRTRRLRRRRCLQSDDESRDEVGMESGDEEMDKIGSSRESDGPHTSDDNNNNENDTAESASLILSSPDHPKWRKVAKKARHHAKNFAQRAARRAKAIVLTPTLILRTMLVDPFADMDWNDILKAYTIDTEVHHDFFVVTVSRLCYYCGQSVQTFFLYYLHDIIGIHDNAEATVAYLAILGQFSGALTCFPIGVLSDRFLGGRRRPLVYLACVILASCTASFTACRTLDQMVTVVLIFGAANGMYLTMDTSLAVDTLPDESAGESTSAQLLGIWGVAAFLGSALGPMIGGPLLYLCGSTADSDNNGVEEYTMTGYAVVLGLSTLYFVLSAWSLWYGCNPPRFPLCRLPPRKLLCDDEDCIAAVSLTKVEFDL
eukprot:scaffold1424_cov168-Amphora_coffeaeformis.AAC.18